MKALVQRVNFASVEINQSIYSKIGYGLLVLLGIHINDTEKDSHWIINKLVNLRVFNDTEEKMNHSIKAVNGEILIVSQFTLYADCKKGNRPSYTKAAPLDKAKKLYEHFIESITAQHPTIKTGQFRASMNIKSENNGPISIMLDSHS